MSGEPTRCWLVSWSTLEGASYSEAVTGNVKPSVAIDVGNDTISVVNPNTNVVVGSAPLVQVTATPAKYARKYWRIGWVALPILVVCVPGVHRLTIGCMERPQRLGNRGYRFSWRDTALREKEPAYVAAGTGWLMLVEKFGLSPQLEGTQGEQSSPTPSGPPPLYSQPRGARIIQRISRGYLALCVAFAVILTILSFFIHSEPAPSTGPPPSTQTTISH